MQKGQIFKIHSDFYYVHSDNGTYECKIREVLKKQKQKIFVGDFVEFEDGAIEKILPRKNYITRPTVANIDQVILVSAVKEPELSFLQKLFSLLLRLVKSLYLENQHQLQFQLQL